MTRGRAPHPRLSWAFAGEHLDGAPAASPVVPFLRWAMATRRAPKLELTRRKFGNAPVVDQAERLAILRRLLDPSTGCIEYRVAAMMLALLGQPFTHTAALRLSDVVVDGEEVSVRPGEGFVPISPPFAGMVTDLVAGRPHLNTASNPTSPFCSPAGARASTCSPRPCGRRRYRWALTSWARGAGLCASSSPTARRRSWPRPSATATKPSIATRSVPDPLGVPTQRCERRSRGPTRPESERRLESPQLRPA